ncbi:MAG: sulfatase-like hydrolase/transferase [Bacteroidales bacterium]|nr:sulfatase-like hydrolase/transferase [Bacteroidales bacterium]
MINRSLTKSGPNNFKALLNSSSQILAVLAFISISCNEKEKAPDLPNILFILADDQRSNTIHSLGNEEIITPNLDKLAESGISFTNAYIMGSYSGAVCMPSRAMLLTGKFLNNLTGDGQYIPPADTLLGEYLQKYGYNCFGTGKYHSEPETFPRCFNEGADIFFGGMWDQWNVPLFTYEGCRPFKADQLPYIEDFYNSKEIRYKRGEYVLGGKHSTDIFTDASLQYIENYDSDKPFFIYAAFMTPHDPRTTHQKYFDMYDTAQISIPPNFYPEHPFDNGELKIRDEMLAPFPRTKPVIKEHIRDYYALITHNDEKLGEIVSALKEKGLYENTIIIYSGDNGLALGQHGLMGKQNLYEHSTGVPLIFAGKGIEKNRVSEAMVYLTDLYPTLCRMIGIPVPSSVDGSSFMESLESPAREHRKYIVTTYRNFQRAIRDEKFKLIQYNVEGIKRIQLFDLENDPWEMNDLSQEPEYQERIGILSFELEKQLKEFNDNKWKF